MKRTARLLACSLLLFAYPRGVGAERVASSATWEYQFPPGIVDFTAMQLTPGIRYLAVTTGRSTYEGSDSAGSVTSEGENAAYYFDLRDKRLLWRKPFPSETAVSVVGLSPSGDILALGVGGTSTRQTTVALRSYQGDSALEGKRALGAPEAGARLYDREGRLLAAGIPLERFSGTLPYAGQLLLRPARAGETAPSDDLRRTLTDAGVTAVPKFTARGAYGFMESAGHKQFVSFAQDGTENWRWELPPGQGELAREWRGFAASPDLGYALVSLTPYEGERPSDVRRLYLFGRSEGLLWEYQAPMMIAGKHAARSIGMQIANAASSALVVRTGPRASVVDALDRSGVVRHSWEFDEMKPAAYSLSPNGHYWAAVLRQTWQGATSVDKGWTAGLHVFDCDTGEVVWRSPAMADAVYVIAMDTAGVVAVSPATRTLAVFDPPG